MTIETLYPMHARIEPETAIHPGDAIQTKILLADDWETIGRYRAYRSAQKADERMPPVRRAIYNRNHCETAIAFWAKRPNMLRAIGLTILEPKHA